MTCLACGQPEVGYDVSGVAPYAPLCPACERVALSGPPGEAMIRAKIRERHPEGLGLLDTWLAWCVTRGASDDAPGHGATVPALLTLTCAGCGAQFRARRRDARYAARCANKRPSGGDP